ncbi:sulfatase family protein [Chryseolinea lacunae]|uniref:Sulfatase n=1 Tax=Chryseolinea lacunae TaxID=2801331 RepID=A0ABS1L265_9BACT|nr:sulfatase [Chryseolinea lacunae]MBL0745799.1 sulfatase [Chryseolinea lacunae]
MNIFLTRISITILTLFSFWAAPGCTAQAQKQEKPNFIWLTFEDASPYGFSCYGNKAFTTPTVDSLAQRGILFTNAYATAPHCSASRSTLITGCFATTFGMDIHREKYQTPSDIFYPSILRANGYFCSNNKKTDYNTFTSDKSLWNECGASASYNSVERKEGQPFFAVFNATASHMSRIRTITTEGRGHYLELGIEPGQLKLPKYLPDLPEVRSDFAVHLESYLEMDAWLRTFLLDLKNRKLAENTIVFFFSDHGGCLPRGKGFPYESGLKIPLIIYIPEKWRDKFDIPAGAVNSNLVGFEDFAPTVLRLSGIDIPPFMQGKPFLGTRRVKKYQFGFRSNQENYHFDPCRTATDGRFKYIRNYHPYKPFALRNLYQSGMPANIAWDEYVLSGKCTNPDWKSQYEAKGTEMLFDLRTDPDELINLAATREHQVKLKTMRKAVSEHIRESKDLGLFYRDMRKEKTGGLFDWVRSTNFPLSAMYDAAEKASMATLRDTTYLSKLLSSQYAEMRYWGAVGYVMLASTKQLVHVPLILTKTMNDPAAAVSATAAEAVFRVTKDSKALRRLVDIFITNDNFAYSSLENLTWVADCKPHLKEYVAEFKKLSTDAEETKADRMGIYLKLRSLLVNLDALPVRELFPQREIEEGIKINETRNWQAQYPKS